MFALFKHSCLQEAVVQFGIIKIHSLEGNHFRKPQIWGHCSVLSTEKNYHAEIKIGC